jgi:hypothetical protein
LPIVESKLLLSSYDPEDGVAVYSDTLFDLKLKFA